MVALPHYTVDPPDANTNFSYSLDPTGTPTFVTLQPQTNNIPMLAIYTNDMNDIGYYVVFVNVIETYSNLSANILLMISVSCV